MRRRWVDSVEADLEYLPQQAQLLLRILGGHWKAAKKECKWTEIIKRYSKVPKKKGNSQRIMAIQNKYTTSTFDKRAPSAASSVTKVLS